MCVPWGVASFFCSLNLQGPFRIQIFSYFLSIYYNLTWYSPFQRALFCHVRFCSFTQKFAANIGITVALSAVACANIGRREEEKS